MRQTQTEVLVVGAGPIGLWTALLLADSGLEVRLIDREANTAARSYACALHPATLRLLDRFGLAESALERGRRVETVALYDGNDRQAELSLSKLGGDFPFLLILPQNALEGLLEQRLRAAGVKVQWNHRFEGLTQEEEGVAVDIEELEGTSTGYIVPHWETVVKNRSTVRTQFLIGTDGHYSMVRSRAGLQSQRFAEVELYAAFEFQSDKATVDELRIVLQETTTSVLWPLAENRARWTFQIAGSDLTPEFPPKDRRAARVAQPIVDERIRQYVERIARERAPWFSTQIKRVDWCTDVSFEKALVGHFGQNRCWLAGDAAHQTGPAGVQSMNVGFAEAHSLALELKKVLREAAPLEVLASYDRQWQEQWRSLLGLEGGLKPQAKASPWLAKRSARILPCLPSYGADLASLAGQIHLAPAQDNVRSVHRTSVQI